MAAQNEIGWQSEKSLTECMRYMLEHEISTDVCFEVGPHDGQTVLLRAHKYMLIARSPVFDAMFSSGMMESNGAEGRVRIEDIDADAFREVLSYIYSETMSPSPDSVVQIMYAAKKYMLSKMIGECRKYLWEILNINNVFDILEQSLFFDDQPLKDDCLRLISMKAKEVFTGEEILTASPQVMGAILDLKIIPVNELVIYEAALKWARHQLPSDVPGVSPTDHQIRKKLGQLLFKIRFPAMGPDEFADICGRNKVLTAKEIESICYFLATRIKDRGLKFPTHKRIAKEFWIERAVNFTTAVCNSVPCLDAIDFKTTQDVLLTGIGLNSAENEAGYDVELEILQSNSSLFKKKVRVPHSGKSTQLKVGVNEPVAILAGVLYTIKTVSRGHIRHFGQICHSMITEKTVTFKFVKHSLSPTNCQTHEQIPRLYFCFL